MVKRKEKNKIVVPTFFFDKNEFENIRTRICSKPVISKTLYSEAFLQVKPELVNLCTYTKWFYKDEKTTHSQL